MYSMCDPDPQGYEWKPVKTSQNKHFEFRKYQNIFFKNIKLHFSGAYTVDWRDHDSHLHADHAVYVFSEFADLLNIVL